MRPSPEEWLCTIEYPDIGMDRMCGKAYEISNIYPFPSSFNLSLLLTPCDFLLRCISLLSPSVLGFLLQVILCTLPRRIEETKDLSCASLYTVWRRNRCIVFTHFGVYVLPSTMQPMLFYLGNPQTTSSRLAAAKKRPTLACSRSITNTIVDQ